MFAGAEIPASARALLGSVEDLIKTQAEFSRLRGENFNVFRLLHLEGNEDELHSRFIAELLDPEGSHDQGDLFLRLFLDAVGQKNWLRTDEAVVRREESIGQKCIKEEESTGGRIDIFITDKRRDLSIENKIGSGEGEKQITRYCNYNPSNNFVLFLTLDGKEADTTKSNYRPISYGAHILGWLESCQQHAADLPLLRETIKQYIITVKRLTGRLTMDAQDKELDALIKQHLDAARRIGPRYDRLLRDAAHELVHAVAEEVRSKLPEPAWKVDVSKDLSKKYTGLYIWRCDWKKRAPGTWVGWEGNPDIAKKSAYGIKCKKGESGRKIWETAQVSDRFPQLTRSIEWWPCWGDFADASFETEQQLKTLLADDRSHLVETIAAKLVELARFCEKRTGASG